MSFYLRKSISVGLFRFNLSKSGLGLSVGVPGFRVGTGPRGNYVHMGRNGIYYRASLPAGTSNLSSLSRKNAIERCVPEPLEKPKTHATLEEIDSDSTEAMFDSTSESLVTELNNKRKKARILWPTLVVVALGLSILALNSVATTILVGAVTLSVLALIASAYKDALSKTAVVFYNIDDSFETAYKGLHDAFNVMAKSYAAWHIKSEGEVYDGKYHAGASNLVERNKIQLGTQNPPFVRTNISTPSIPVGNQTLYFFPDMVLVYETAGVGAVSYSELAVRVSSQRFIEDETVPSDTKVVGETWRYVNKNGGPDRRFNNNRKIPIVLYEDVDLSSESGLRERIELSRVGGSAGFAKAIQQAGSLTITIA